MSRARVWSRLWRWGQGKVTSLVGGYRPREADLRRAVKYREFFVVYQPIVDLATNRCVGAEALVRWLGKNGKLVMPDQFVPLAERTGLIAPITDQIIDGIVRDMRAELEANPSLHIAINTSAGDIETGRILSLIAEKIKGTGILPRQFWIEATERVCININSSRTTLDCARQIGHSVAIDDFGTGYSSLQYLQDLPANVLKIDRSFINRITTREESYPVVDCIIEMAKRLKMVVVAEGVESGIQAAYLKNAGVGFAQGWLFGRPLSSSEFRCFFYSTNLNFSPCA